MKQLKRTDMQVLSHLRENGRVQLTTLSKKIRLPVSTLHDKLKRYLEKGVMRSTVLLCFDKLGFGAKAHILLSVEKETKDKALEYLKFHPHVNSVYRINNGWHLLMEVIFKNMSSLESFVDDFEAKFPIKQKQVHYVIDELKREGFLRPEHV